MRDWALGSTSTPCFNPSPPPGQGVQARHHPLLLPGHHVAGGPHLLAPAQGPAGLLVPHPRSRVHAAVRGLPAPPIHPPISHASQPRFHSACMPSVGCPGLAAAAHVPSRPVPSRVGTCTTFPPACPPPLPQLCHDALHPGHVGHHPLLPHRRPPHAGHQRGDGARAGRAGAGECSQWVRPRPAVPSNPGPAQQVWQPPSQPPLVPAEILGRCAECTNACMATDLPACPPPTCCPQSAPPAKQLDVWKKGVCSDTFHPRFRRCAPRRDAQPCRQHGRQDAGQGVRPPGLRDPVAIGATALCT